MPLVREGDLIRHLETGPIPPDQRDHPRPQVLEMLERDNQLRLALEMVKAMPRLKALR
jgi:carboxyl-terminal processing protease